MERDKHGEKLLQEEDIGKWQPYSCDTLIGNWNEEKFDVKELSKARCLPSQYGHYYNTNYKLSYDKSSHKVPEVLRYQGL